MEYLDIKGLRPFASSDLIDEVIAQQSRTDKLWRLSFKLKNGKKFGLSTARKDEKTYVKFETLIDEIEELMGKKINKIKII